MTLRLGDRASAEQVAPRTLLRDAVLAEQAGFESVLVSDEERFSKAYARDDLPRARARQP